MFQENLSSLRKKNGLTQDMLASKLQVTRQTISKWEKGYSVPDADVVLKIAEIFDVDVSVLLDTKIPNVEKDDAIAKQLARIAEQICQNNRRRKLFWNIVYGIFAALVLVAGYYMLHRITTTQYGYICSQALYKDASVITDADTLEWIKACDKQEMKYYILFSDYSPAEISQGYVGKMLVYVPDGFSGLNFYLNDDSNLFRRGKKIDLQISEPYTEEKTYRLVLLETPQNNIATITLQDVSGTPLNPGITRIPGSFYAFGKYYGLYHPDGCDMAMRSASTVDSFLNHMPIEEHFGSFEYIVSGNQIHLTFKTMLDSQDNREMRCWGLMFIARMRDSESFSWSYLDESGNTITKEVTRSEFNSLFPNGYHRTWEEFQTLCPL